ncbi:MAG TPA: hypothetical protein VFG46_02765 [Chryseolinea sp.]|nr:hypothetical protein [Chryseolinea sp.]
MKKFVFIATLMSVGSVCYAQDFIDNALLFSRTRPSGSARIQALGGAQVSLGGDYSSALSNPAGLGKYNRSEVTFSPGLTTNNFSSDYLGQNTEASKSMFNIPGLSLVYHHETGKEKGFLGGSFGISMTRTNDLNRTFNYRGSNDENSMVDYFIDDAYGIDPETMLWRQNQNPGANFTTLTGLAYNNFLIDDYIVQDENGNDVMLPNGKPLYAYRSVLSPLPAEPGFPAEVRTVDQEELSESKGSQYQWSISYGANFSDKFFLGAGIGVTSIRYKVTQYFTESNFRYSEDPTYVPIDNFKTKENYDIRGSGVNFTIGAILRPVDFLQVGASFATPTYYNMTDTYTARIESVWNYYGDPNNDSFPPRRDVSEHFEDIPVISEYNLSTPLRVTTGATFISKFGFISGEVEFVDYGKAKYDSDIADDFDAENDGVKAEYQPVVNYRLGAEYRYEIYRIRAGYNYMQDPYRQPGNIDHSVQSFSGGLGVRTKKFFVDLGAIFSSTEGTRSPYYSTIGNDPVAFQKFKTANYILTFGFTF